MGNKLGKLLKVDVVTSAAIRGRYARLCIQINMAYPFQYARCVKIGAFWQAIIYENLPMLCYQCGRLGHREVHCTETSDELKATFPPGLEPRREQGTTELEHPHTPWKTVQTERSRPRGTNIESHPRGKLLQCNTYPPINQRGFTASTKSHVISKQQAGSDMSMKSRGRQLGLTKRMWNCMVKTMIYYSHVNCLWNTCRLPTLIAVQG